MAIKDRQRLVDRPFLGPKTACQLDRKPSFFNPHRRFSGRRLARILLGWETKEKGSKG
jgi:hypothetical protein